MAFDLPLPPELDDPLLGFRFGVFFLGTIGLDHPLDFRFQSVSGLSVDVQTEQIGGTGTTVSGIRRPTGLNYDNLVLERGMPLISTLGMEIQNSFVNFQFRPRNVLLSVMDENALPLQSWMIQEAFPVKWNISGLDATASRVIVEHIELSYKSFKPFFL